MSPSTDLDATDLPALAPEADLRLTYESVQPDAERIEKAVDLLEVDTDASEGSPRLTVYLADRNRTARDRLTVSYHLEDERIASSTVHGYAIRPRSSEGVGRLLGTNATLSRPACANCGTTTWTETGTASYCSRTCVDEARERYLGTVQ